MLLYAIARTMILGHGSTMDNLLGVFSIGLIFVIRKFLFVPSFGSSRPGSEVIRPSVPAAPDTKAPDDAPVP